MLNRSGDWLRGWWGRKALRPYGAPLRCAQYGAPNTVDGLYLSGITFLTDCWGVTGLFSSAEGWTKYIGEFSQERFGLE